MKGAITITFGEVCENHVGMQKVGALATKGFSHDDLGKARTFFHDKGCVCELMDLKATLRGVVTDAVFNEISPAWLLVIRDGLSKFVNKDDLWTELVGLKWDTEALMYGRVVEKHARHNLCFSDMAQAPNYQEGKGTVVAFADALHLAVVRARLPQCLGEGAEHLLAEGNLYFDPGNCGIGYHGDSERKKVVAVRLGASLPICYQWFFQTNPVGPRIRIDLNGGDMYVMSEYAVGTNWKSRSVYTLRHAAGADKFIVYKAKKAAKKKRKVGSKDGNDDNDDDINDYNDGDSNE